jgi:hypothetical protein
MHHIAQLFSYCRLEVDTVGFKVMATVMDIDQVRYRVLTPTRFQLTVVQGHTFLSWAITIFAVMPSASFNELHDSFVDHSSSSSQ